MPTAFRNVAHSIVLGLVLIAGQGLAHDAHAVPVPTASKSGTQIQAAGLAFWHALNDAQRATLAYGFDSPEAVAYWAPSQNNAADTLGLRLSDLSRDQRRRLDDILIASTSSQGFFKIQAAMQHDRSSDVHRIAIFGNPHTDSFWSYSLNGPQLRYNVMIRGGHMVLMPVFYGVEALSNEHMTLPQEFTRGFELMRSLTPDQRKAAIVMSNSISTQEPFDLGTNPHLFEHRGISGDQLRSDQRSLMWKLIVEYVANSDFDVAADHFKSIHSGGWQDLYFIWMGPIDGRGPVFYRLSGPSILIEFAAMSTDAGEDFHLFALVRDPNSVHGANWLTHHVHDHK